VSTAEHTWGLILSLAKQIPREDAAVRRGGWQTSVGTVLLGTTIGIVGLGKIGGRVAHYARSFGAIPIAWSQNLTEERAAECGALLVDKRSLFEQADFVTVCVYLGERTVGLIGAPELALMKPTAYLVNTARGPIVDEEALVAALRQRVIAGAALDVYDREPLRPSHPLRELDNTILTPHSAYVTVQGYRTFFEDVVEDIRAFLDGVPIRLLNPGAPAWEHTRVPTAVLVHGRLAVAQTTPGSDDVELTLPIVRSDGAPFAGHAACEVEVAGTAVPAETIIAEGCIRSRFQVPSRRRGSSGSYIVSAREDDAQLQKRFSFDIS
jgi:hypothetical protein